MSDRRPYRNFQELCEDKIREGANVAEARRYLKQGKIPLKLAIRDEREKLAKAVFEGNRDLAGKHERIISSAEEKGMVDGSLEIAYEGARRIYNKIRAMVHDSKDHMGEDYSQIFEHFDPIEDQDLISTGIFCLVPEVRKFVMDNSETLYRISLSANSRDRAGYTLPTRQKQKGKGVSIISPPMVQLISSLPIPQTKIEEENQRKLKILFDRKVERESFHDFRDDPLGTIKNLESRINETENPHLRDAYQRLHNTYSAYINFEVQKVNPYFRDPSTGNVGVLPSLHQRSALHHLMKEKKLGIFDGCGTGKTAIATLAQPLIEKQLGRKPKVLIVCTDPAKKAWKNGLVGDKSQKYLSEPQDIIVVNRDRKDQRFMHEVEAAHWVIMNYEQLITKVNGNGRLFVDELGEMNFDYLIFDESHHIKSQRTRTKSSEQFPEGRMTISVAAQQLTHKVEYTALLTATPISDSLKDYGVLASILQPDKFPTPESLRAKIRYSPRELYTFFHERTVRRTANDINDELDWEELSNDIELTPIQKIVYEHLELQRPNNWLQQARKALLDPRLVDPEVLRRAGVLGDVGIYSSAKYLKLEELLISDDGPVARGEKFIVFTKLREGVTQEDNARLMERYDEIDAPELYSKLQLNITLEKILQESLQRKFGSNLKVGVIDGTVPNIEDREEIVDRLSQEGDLVGLVCTTDSGGESLDFTAASYVVFLDEDYSPKTSEQALSRVVRKGQNKKVTIVHLHAPNTIDEDIEKRVHKKKVIAQIAMDGHSLIEEEIEFLEDIDGNKIVEMLKKRVGGTSIDTYLANIESLDNFETRKRNPKSRGNKTFLTPQDYETTNAQMISQLIGQDPVNCWFNPKFVELYMETLQNLSVPVVHRARIIDLIKRANEKQVIFPRTVLAEASGPSMLWEAYQSLRAITNGAGYRTPTVTDRDISSLMIAEGKNPRKIIGNMNGENSELREKSFDMVDNGSLLLLQSGEDIKRTLVESHRVLKDNGLLELVLKNKRFSDSFYSGMERLGFEIVSEKNEGFSISKKFSAKLKEIHGEHFAESYAAKLADTYLLLARKVDALSDVKAKEFTFEKIESEETPRSEIGDIRNMRKSVINVRGGRKRGGWNKLTNHEKFTPEIEVTVDKSGVVQKVEKPKKKRERIE